MSTRTEWETHVDRAIAAVRQAPYGAQIPGAVVEQMRAALLDRSEHFPIPSQMFLGPALAAARSDASAITKAWPVHPSPERIMDLWNEAIDADGSNIIKFASLLISEDRASVIALIASSAATGGVQGGGYDR